ncbi:MAG: metallophosphoesterase [Gemmatimonadaceae bacterium]
MRPRRFGRARSLPRTKRVAEFIYDQLYRGGWASALAHPLGLQGTLRAATHDVTLPAPAGDVAPPPLRVAFASDLHAGPATHPAILAGACRALEEAHADLVLLGGDYVSFHARFVDALVPLLARAEAPLGKFAVLGNHDLIGDDGYITQRLAEAGVRVLVNENARLAAPYDHVSVCGLDDPEEGSPDGAAALAGAAATRLVLMHSPEGLRALEGQDFAMAFCGHVHGGQCWVGERSMIGVHGAHNTRCRRGGLFDLDGDGGRMLLVSRGIGQGSLPLRRHADPETHVCTITWRPMASGKSPKPPG